LGDSVIELTISFGDSAIVLGFAERGARRGLGFAGPDGFSFLTSSTGGLRSAPSFSDRTDASAGRSSFSSKHDSSKSSIATGIPRPMNRRRQLEPPGRARVRSPVNI